VAASPPRDSGRPDDPTPAIRFTAAHKKHVFFNGCCVADAVPAPTHFALQKSTHFVAAPARKMMRRRHRNTTVDVFFVLLN
jgi:hypothetical protein